MFARGTSVVDVTVRTKKKGTGKQSMPTFKVLSIDGGGIRGLYAARILESFEAELNRLHGSEARLADYVDLVCGTSTGGLIALAIALKIPASRIVRLYEDRGPKIFKGSNSRIALLRQILWGGKYRDKELRAGIEDVFGERKIGESHCLLCIPSFDFTHNTYEVFKFDHSEGKLSRHNNLSLIEVALATSAAPTYFPLAEIPREFNRQYVDGGVWANNPSLVGFLEAGKYFVGKEKAYDRLALLSIASIAPKGGHRPGANRNRSFINWADSLFDLSLTGQSEFAHILLREIGQNNSFPVDYLRIGSPEIPPRQAGLLKLDYAMPNALNLMNQCALDQYHQIRQQPFIQRFWETPKTYILRQ